ncbi:MAG: sigma-70 family RNA polymerase sigma factor [Victivallales bacterium]|nr:sigma-70 family RNA polymerase sigma factor [Victivallales bacterium]
MPHENHDSQKELWGRRFQEHQGRLLSLARRSLNPVLLKRVTSEDVVQETFSAALVRMEFLENQPEIPLYCKLRIILLQKIKDLERYHLQSQKRDAYKEVEVSDGETAATGQANWNMFADTMTGPFTRLAREERHQMLRKCLEEMEVNDRMILELRHFDGMSNAECAEVLQIQQKAASIRYFRALQRLKQKLTDYTEFRNE